MKQLNLKTVATQDRIFDKALNQKLEVAPAFRPIIAAVAAS